MRRKMFCSTEQSPPKGKRKLDYVPSKTKSSVKLPLVGKTVYLDVKETKHRKRLQHDLKRLGGTIEEFLSKDINYLITTQSRPRQRKQIGCDGDAPVPSPFNCDPSPSPGNAEERRATSVTRGKALAEKARVQARETNSLVDNAEKWGVRIVSLEGAYKWIDKELKKLPKQVLSKKSHKSGCVAKYKNFKAPFLKIEVSNFCYRPLHYELETWPRLNVDTPRGSCPFDGTLIKGGDHSNEERGELLAAQVDIQSEETPKEEKDGLSNDSNNSKISQGKAAKRSEQESATNNKILTAGEIRRQKDLKRKQERKRGYCECCQVKYDDLDKHVREEQHRAYIKEKCHYEKLDEVINSGPNTVTFISQCLSKAVSMRNPKTKPCSRDDEVMLIDSSPLKDVHSSPCKESHQNSLKRTPTKSRDRKDSEKKEKMSVSQAKCRTPKKNQVKASPITINRESSSNLQNKQVQEKEDTDIDLKYHKTTPTKKNEKEVKKQKEINSRKHDNVLKEKTQNSPIQSKAETSACNKASPRLSSKPNLESKQMGKLHNSPRFSPRLHKVEKENNSTQSSKKCDTSSVMSPKSSKCLSSLFDKEIQKKKLSDNETCLDENDEKASEANSSEMQDIVIGEVSKKSNRSNDRSEKLSDGKHGHKENKLVKEKPEGDLNNSIDADNSKTEKDLSAKSKVKAVLDVCSNNFQKTQSGNDSEACLKNALDNQIKEKRRRNERNSLINENENKLKVETNESQDMKSKKKNKKKQKKGDGLAQSSKEKDKSLSNEKRKSDKEKYCRKKVHKGERSPLTNESRLALNTIKTTVVDDCSDIPSDRLQNLGEDFLIFTKTLAERIKERSRSRPASETSFNQSYNANSDLGTSKKKSKPKTASQLSSKVHKSRANIASQKVLNKYRAQRGSARRTENTQAGYEGDDEMRAKDTSRSKKTTNRARNNSKEKETAKKAERQKFWYYEPVNDEGVTTDGSITSEQSRPTRNSSRPRCQYQEVSDVDSVGHIDNKKDGDTFAQPQKKKQIFKSKEHSIKECRAKDLSKKSKQKYDSAEYAQNEYDFESSDVSYTATVVTKKKHTNKEAKIESDNDSKEQSTSFKKPKSKKFWFYTTEPSNNEDSLDETVEILPSKLRRLNGQRDALNIDSEKYTESDTNKQSDSDHIENTRSTKKSKSKKFWYYVTEPVNDDKDLNDVEVLPSKLRRFNGQRESLNVESEQDKESDVTKESDTETTKKNKSKKFWFCTTEPVNNDKDFNDVEILPSKLRRVNGRKESQTVDSEQEIENDTNNLSESDTNNVSKTELKPKAVDPNKKSKSKRFWFYATEPVKDDNEMHKVEILPSKLRHSIGRRESNFNESEQDSDVTKQSDSELIKKPREAKIKSRRGSQTNESKQESESDSNNLSNSEATPKAIGSKKKSKSKKFWFYTTEPVPVDNYMHKEEILPSKLRHSVGRQELHVNESEQDIDSDVTKESDCEIIKKPRETKIKPSRRESQSCKSGQDIESDLNNVSGSEPISTVDKEKKSKSKKFWFYTTEPVEDDNEMHKVEILPSKLRNEIGRRASQVNESGQDIESDATKQSDSEVVRKTDKMKKKSKGESQKVESKQEIESDTIKQTNSEIKDKGKSSKTSNSKKFSFYTTEPINDEENINEAVEILPSKLRKLNRQRDSLNVDSGKYTESVSKNSDSESINNSKESTKKSKSKKFWFYVTEPVNDDDNIVDDVEVLPEKLRHLKGRRDSSISDSEVKRRKNSHFPTPQTFKNEHKKSEDKTFKSSSKEHKVINSNHAQAADSDNVGKHKAKTKEVETSIEENKAEKSENKRRKSDSAKFWTYESFIEPESDEPDSDLPKELQILKSAWNNLSDVSDIHQPRRSRDCTTNISYNEEIIRKRAEANRKSSQHRQSRTCTANIYYNEDIVEYGIESKQTKSPKSIEISHKNSQPQKNHRSSDNTKNVESQNKIAQSKRSEETNYKNSQQRQSRCCTTNINYNEDLLGDRVESSIKMSPSHNRVESNLKNSVQRQSRSCTTNINYNEEIVKDSENSDREENSRKSSQQNHRKSESTMNNNEDVVNSEEKSHKHSKSHKKSSQKADEVEKRNVNSNKCNTTNNTDSISAKDVNNEQTEVCDDSKESIDKTNEHHKSVKDKSDMSKEERRHRRREKRKKKEKRLRNYATDDFHENHLYRNSSKDSPEVTESDHVSQRSCSPTFNRTSSGSQERQERRQEKRPGSPVFAATPPSKRHKTCDNNSLSQEQSKSSSVSQKHKSNNIANKQEGSKSIPSSLESISPIKKTDKANMSVLQKSVCKTTPVKTPESKIRVSTPASGYSTTSREVRRKQWKRKKEMLLSSGLSNDESSPGREMKKRKLEKLKYKIDMDVEVGSDSSASNIVVNHKGNTDLDKLDEKHEVVRDNRCIPNSPLVKPLSWNPQSAQKKSGQTVKLDKSWTLLSERSVTKLLSSEGDQTNFEGFSQEEVDKSLRSDLSYEECSELSLKSDSEHEWVVEETKDTENDAKVEEFEKFVPLPFSSPGKRSDSSWLDACEDYMDKSLKKDNKDSSIYLSFVTSPWKSPVRRSKVPQDSSNCSTPIKQITSPGKEHDRSVKRVDREIEFNFGSPQKLRGEFSPLRCKNGKVVDISSPVGNYSVKPVKSKGVHCKKLLDKYSGLVFSGDDDNSDSDRNQTKQTEFKLLKKVSSNKKVYNIVYEKSPTKVKKKKKVSV